MKRKIAILGLALVMFGSSLVGENMFYQNVYASDASDKYKLPDGYKFLTSFKFDDGFDFNEGLALVYDSNTKKCGFIDETGKLVIPYQFTISDWYPYFSEGLIPVMSDDKAWRKWGYIDKTGSVAIPYQFKEGKQFKEGLAAVQDFETDKWGYIDKTGKLIIPYQFDEANTFSEGLAAVRDPETYKYGYVDTTGKLVIPYQFGSVDRFSEGLAAVQDSETDKWGYIDKTGKLVIPYQFDEPNTFNEGLAVMYDAEMDRYGYIDKTGKLVIPYQFSGAFGFREGLAAVSDEKTSKYGYIDKTGKMVIPYQFSYATSFRDGGLAVVGKPDESNSRVVCGVIDNKGNTILPFHFFADEYNSMGLPPGDLKDGIIKLTDLNTGKAGYIAKSDVIQGGNYIFYPRNGQKEEKFEINGFVDLRDLFKMSTIPNKEGYVFMGWFIGQKLEDEGKPKLYDATFRENIYGLKRDSSFYAAYVNKDILDIKVDPNKAYDYEFSEMYLNKDELEDYRYNDEVRRLMSLLNTCKHFKYVDDTITDVFQTDNMGIFEDDDYLLKNYDATKDNKLSIEDYYKLLDSKNDDYFEDKENNK